MDEVRAILFGLAGAVVVPSVALLLLALWPLVLLAAGLLGPFVLMGVLPAAARADSRRAP